MTSREGTVAVVIGAGRGRGRQIAWSLAGAGARVIACARTAADLEATVAGASSVGSILAWRCDVGEPRDVDALPANGYVTGTVIRVDGGQRALLGDPSSAGLLARSEADA